MKNNEGNAKNGLVLLGLLMRNRAVFSAGLWEDTVSTLEGCRKFCGGKKQALWVSSPQCLS